MISREQAIRILAEKLFGVRPELIHFEPQGKDIETAIGSVKVACTPDYFTDPVASDALLDKLAERFDYVEVLTNKCGSRCALVNLENGFVAESYRTAGWTRQVAICGAALEFVGVTEGVEG